MNSEKNDDEYEIVNNRKLKKCKENQIRNPITKRCVLKSSDIGKKIMNVKKICPEDKILNYKTNKCVSKTTALGKKLLNDKYNKLTKIVRKTQVRKEVVRSDIKIERLQKNIREQMYPFVNRVSAHIYDRKLYYLMLMKFLRKNKFKNKNSNCIKIHDKDRDIYNIIDTNIIFKYINDNYSIGTFNDKNLKLFKFALQIDVNNTGSLHELAIYDKLTTAIINEECPHFPFYYTHYKCKQDDAAKISPMPITMKYSQHEKFIIILTEFTNGNFADFIKEFYHNTPLIKNAIAQIFISLFFFYTKIKSFHKNACWHSFLYHKIKPGGFFHYKIFNKDYYIENLGYLWVISDFKLTIVFNPYTTITIDHDINKFNIEFNNNKITEKLHQDVISFHEKLKSYHSSSFLLHTYSATHMNKLISKLMSLLVSLEFIHTSFFSSSVINKEPYIIDLFT